jgi:hypothetical protein
MLHDSFVNESSTHIHFLFFVQILNTNLMLVRVIGVSHPLCPWVSSMIQLEVTL